MEKRWKLILAVLACLALLSFAAFRFSEPVAKTVAPLPEIETIWDIEDTYLLSGTPLLSTLSRGGVPLPRDASGTFYCPLGLGRGEEWPELVFSLPQGVNACFADDYLWDACHDAIAQGTRYRILVWTDEAYCYQDIIFTGLPLVSLSCGRKPEEILGEDVPAELLFSAPDGSLSSHARIHRRGGASFSMGGDKKGYRVELTRGADGSKKVRQNLPVLGETDTFVLLPIAEDETKMRERLGWELWNSLCEENEPFGRRAISYCELFMDGDYRGVYLVLGPYQAAEELARAGAAEGAVYRTSVNQFLRGRTAVQHPIITGGSYRLYYGPENDPADGIAPYVQLVMDEDDDTFRMHFAQRADLDSLLRFDLLVQACALADNVFNNLFIWMTREDSRLSIRVAPWDMDMSFGLRPEEIGQSYEYWLYYPIVDRALYLDCENARARISELWAQYRSGVFSDESVPALSERFAEELNDSGAMARDAERWQTEQYIAEPQKILDFWPLRMAVVDDAITRIAGGDVDFLTLSQYHEKGGPVRIPEEAPEDSGEEWDEWDEEP